VHGDYTGQGEVTNVEANNTSGGAGPVRPKIPLGILIFLVVFNNLRIEILVKNGET